VVDILDKKLIQCVMKKMTLLNRLLRLNVPKLEKSYWNLPGINMFRQMISPTQIGFTQMIWPMAMIMLTLLLTV